MTAINRKYDAIIIGAGHNGLTAASYLGAGGRKTPYVSLIVQMVAGILFVFLAQAGTSVKGAYDVLVSMGIITYFIPYLYLFASMFKLQRQEAGPEVIRVPGGSPVARLIACVGFTTTLLTIAMSLVPSPEEANKILAVFKVVGLTGILLVVGWLIYYLGNRRKRSLVAEA